MKRLILVYFTFLSLCCWAEVQEVQVALPYDPQLFVCNAGIRHQKKSDQCFSRSSGQTCHPQDCSHNNCDECICVSGSGMGDVLRATSYDVSIPEGEDPVRDQPIALAAGNEGFTELYSAKEAWDHALDSLSFSLGSEMHGAEYFIDICYKASHIAAADPETLICHLPPGNNQNLQTLLIPQSAISTHLAHGDYLGWCENEKDPKVLVCHVPPGNPESAHTILVDKNAAIAHLRNHQGDSEGMCAQPRNVQTDMILRLVEMDLSYLSYSRLTHLQGKADVICRKQQGSNIYASSGGWINILSGTSYSLIHTQNIQPVVDPILDCKARYYFYENNSGMRKWEMQRAKLSIFSDFTATPLY